MAKVIHVSKPGGAEYLSIDDVDVPEPGPGEVRFKVSAFHPRIDRVFSLAETVDAYRYMLSNAQCGKIVVSLIDE